MLNSYDAITRGPFGGFVPGLTLIPCKNSSQKSANVLSDLDFSILRLSLGQAWIEQHQQETAWILLCGKASVQFAEQSTEIERTSLFDHSPTVLHLGPTERITILSLAPDTEFAVVRTSNERAFAPRLFLPAEIKPEYRGAGLVQNACLRNVRLIFDRTTRPESNLVVGEVINYPGRWSSYPPHHHDQPEIYHYRFTHPDGYGHAELGEDVFKIRSNDTVFIPPGLDHAQVSAPGYGMYYLWMIRHLPDNPYTGFTFAPEHKWTLDPAQQGWLPPDTF